MAGARQQQPERTHAGEAAVPLTHRARDPPRRLDVRPDEIDVERDQRPPRADDHAAAQRIEPRRAEVRRHVAVVDAPLQLDRAAAPKECRPAIRRELAVEEHRQLELGADPSRELQCRRPRALHVVRAQRHHRHDVGRTDPRMRTVVRAEVDPLARDRDPREQRVDELRVVADEREDGTVVVLVRVDVEQRRALAERTADRVDDRVVASLGEVRNRFERQAHGRSLRRLLREHLCAVLADRRRHDPEPHPHVEALTADADPERRLERREHGDHRDQRVRRRVLVGRVIEERRRHREQGSDRLREPLRRSRRVAVPHVEARRDDPRRDERERAELRPRQDPGEEPVGEHRDQPALLECNREHAQHRDGSGDEPGRGLVDGIREREERAHVEKTVPAVNSLASLQRDTARCRACADAGFRIESLPVRAPYAGQRAYLFGQAPGIVEGEQRLPWRGRAGQALRRWLELDEAEFYDTFYCASVTRCYPGRAASGRGDRAPTPREQDLCEVWRDRELALLQPRLIVTVGGLALRRMLGLAELTPAIGERYERDGAAVIPLPHPSGASSWPNVPANKVRLARALELVHAELARLDS